MGAGISFSSLFGCHFKKEGSSKSKQQLKLIK
jgi:hypothetical protein